MEWLGEVPEHWGVKKIAHVADLIAGFAFPSEQFEFDPESGIPLVRGDNVTEGWLRWGEKGRYWPFGLEYEKRYLLEENDIVIQMDGSKVGKNWAIVGKADLPALLVQRVTRVRVAEAVPRFIYSLFSNEMFVRYVDRAKTDPAIPHITMKNIGDYWIPMPPHSEQIAITCFLDRETAKIDALVAEQRRLIELLKEKRQAVISHAVTKGLNPHAPMKPSGVEWLGDVPEHWRVMRVKHLTRSIEQGWSPQCEGFPVETENEWGVLKVGCVNGGTFNSNENKVLPPDLEPIPELGISFGDLLISRANTRELVGSAAVAAMDYPRLLLCDKLYRLRLKPDLGLPTHLSHYLGSNAAREQIELGATGASASMVNIGQSVILELKLAVPPIDEQHSIVATLGRDTAKLDALTVEAQRAIDILQERRTALISAAVTGKIDVRGLVNTEVA